MKSFTQCLQRSGANLTICTDIIRGHCPERFGANWTQMAECRRGLSSVSVGRLDQVGGYRSRRLKHATAVTERRASDNVERANATRPTRLVRAARQMPRKETTTRVLANDKNRRGKGKSEQEKRHPRGAPSVQGLGSRKTALQQQRGGEFRRYSQCIARQAAVVSPCTSHLEAACQSSDLRVVKTVRAAMSETDVLFRTLPNFRLVHLIRDPRGVVNSRRGYTSFHGIGSGYDAVPEARIYCRDVLRDIKARRVLAARWVCQESFCYWENHTPRQWRHISPLPQFDYKFQMNSCCRVNFDVVYDM